MLNKIIQISSNSVFDCRSIGRSTLLWEIGGYSVHGQVLMTTWFVLQLLQLLHLQEIDLKAIPEGLQNLTEYITEFIRDLAKTQIGEEEYVKWVPFLGTIFLFVLSQTGPELLSHGI
jgi:F-type H+-transporting ATPase subunit a